jgi:CheY-like chemotaxis protein
MTAIGSIYYEEEGLFMLAESHRGALRRWVQVILLISMAFIVLMIEMRFELSEAVFSEWDKSVHYQTGRGLATAFFLLFYSALVSRLLLSRSDRISRFLLWLPLFLFLGAGVAFLGVFVLALGKEALDAGGLGRTEWLDVEATLHGALTLTPAVALVMAVTPLLLFLDMALIAPETARADMARRFPAIGSYLRAQGRQAEHGPGADVLLVEDDIHCATVALNFCESLDLHCHHVASIQDAREYLRLYGHRLRLIMLDNFVQLGRDGTNTTGTEWLEDLRREYPPEERPFAVALITGHTDLLSERAHEADIVLQKPWRARPLLDLLRERGVLESRKVPA